MALSNEQFSRSNNNLSVVSGKWTKRVEAGTAGAVARQLTKGKHQGETVYEVGYPTLSGMMVSGKLVDSEMVGMTAEVVLQDGNEVYDLSFSASVKEMSQHLKNFVRCLPNVDKSKMVFLSIKAHPKKKTRTGGPVYNLGVYQDGKQVPDFYVEWKKGPDGKPFPVMLHGFPEAEKLRDGSYDFRDQNEFLLMKFEEYFAGFEPAFQPTTVHPDRDEVPHSVIDEQESQIPVDDDGVPF